MSTVGVRRWWAVAVTALALAPLLANPVAAQDYPADELVVAELAEAFLAALSAGDTAALAPLLPGSTGHRKIC